MKTKLASKERGQVLAASCSVSEDRLEIRHAQNKEFHIHCRFPQLCVTWPDN